MKTVKDLCKEYGYSQTALGKRFDIPLRTVQDWRSERRTPPPYIVSMMDEILKREKEDHKPLIDRATWEQAQDVLQKKKTLAPPIISKEEAAVIKRAVAEMAEKGKLHPETQKELERLREQRSKQ